MGGGNAQKSATARARNAAKKSKEKASNSASRFAPKPNVCQYCRQNFQCTVQKDELEKHVLDDKHVKAGKTFASCFPDYNENQGGDESEGNAKPAAKAKKGKK